MKVGIVADTRLLNALRELDDRTLLAVGYNTVRNRRLATEAGNLPLATLHSVVNTVVDRVLLERANRSDDMREFLSRDEPQQ
jgi:hypothetical protein